MAFESGKTTATGPNITTPLSLVSKVVSSLLVSPTDENNNVVVIGGPNVVVMLGTRVGHSVNEGDKPYRLCDVPVDISTVYFQSAGLGSKNGVQWSGVVID